MSRLVATRVIVGLLVLAGGLGSARADQVNLGTISFDIFIPAGPSAPGTNAFDISNFTGGFNLPPDFPVADDLTFLTSFLILTGTQPDPSNPGSTILLNEKIPLGDIGPGFPAFALQFPDTFSFSQAELQGTLSSTTFALANGGSTANGPYPDGSSFTANSSSIDVLLLPSSGNNLMAGTDQVVISVSGTVSAQAVPEPASSSLVLLLLLGIGGWAYKRQKTRSINPVV